MAIFTVVVSEGLTPRVGEPPFAQAILKWQFLTFQAGQWRSFIFQRFFASLLSSVLPRCLVTFRHLTSRRFSECRKMFIENNANPSASFPQYPAFVSVQFKTCRSWRDIILQQVGL